MRWLTGKHKNIRIILSVLSVVGLAMVFLFQSVNVTAKLGLELSPITQFLINKTIRFLINDILVITLIYAIFWNKKYLTFSVYVQLMGTALFLIPYFLLKLYYPGYDGPLVSFLHRLIINPVLLILLIPAFYYQDFLSTKNS